MRDERIKLVHAQDLYSPTQTSFPMRGEGFGIFVKCKYMYMYKYFSCSERHAMFRCGMAT